LKNVSPGLLLRNYDDIHENEANWLGGCLQIPFDGLVTAFLKGKVKMRFPFNMVQALTWLNFTLISQEQSKKSIL